MMELSSLFSAVIFAVPFALGLFLLGAMAVDTRLASRTSVTATPKAAAKKMAAKDRSLGNIGHYVPA